MQYPLILTSLLATAGLTSALPNPYDDGSWKSVYYYTSAGSTYAYNDGLYTSTTATATATATYTAPTANLVDHEYNKPASQIPFRLTVSVINSGSSIDKILTVQLNKVIKCSVSPEVGNSKGGGPPVQEDPCVVNRIFPVGGQEGGVDLQGVRCTAFEDYFGLKVVGSFWAAEPGLAEVEQVGSFICRQ